MVRARGRLLQWESGGEPGRDAGLGPPQRLTGGGVRYRVLLRSLAVQSPAPTSACGG